MDNLSSTSRSRVIPSGEVLILRHTSKVCIVCAWSPSASIISAGPDDFYIRTISDESGGSRPQCDHSEVLEYVPAHQGQSYIAALDWNKEGTLLATGFAGQARIWSIHGELIRTFSGHTDTILTLKWNKASTYIVTGGSEGTTIVWSDETSEPVQQFNDHSDRVLGVDWLNELTFATCSGDCEIHVFTIGVSQPIMTISGHQGPVNCVKWDPTGSLLASCSNDHAVKIWRMGQAECVHNFTEHEQAVNVIQWSPTGPGTTNPNQRSILASGSDDGTVKLWDIEQGELLCSLDAGLWDPINSLAFSPNGEYVVSGAGQQINIWSVTDKQVIRFYTNDDESGSASDDVPGTATCVCWNENGDKVAAGFTNGTVHVFSFRMRANRVDLGARCRADMEIIADDAKKEMRRIGRSFEGYAIVEEFLKWL
ncbi:hypothetical protein BUALT_Bualt17G0103100 [Buddleja alternifolia]|uniref:WD40 repeat-like protein n=1 Tax=Buddleja alternifolia TaxID=168488 RepID=A0AAV6WFX9_9LAMI|nr:hypothetical protein BUALT_Bualt17G0103100 [Buddleja alternifolia]